MADVKNANVTSGVGAQLVDTGVNAGKQFVSGFINDYFARRAEKRMDERNRSLISDTPALQVEGRRKAGLNPYNLSDAQLPGMSAQSDVRASASDLSHPATLNNIMAFERLDLDRMVAESTANRNNAEADNLRGDTEWTLEKIVGEKINNQIKEVDLAVKEFNFEQAKLQAPKILEQLDATIAELWAKRDALVAQADVDRKQLDVMDASIAKLEVEKVYVETLRELAQSQKDFTDEDRKLLRERFNLDVRAQDWKEWIDDIKVEQDWERIDALWEQNELLRDKNEIDRLGIDVQREKNEIEKAWNEISADLKEEENDISWLRDIFINVCIALIAKGLPIGKAIPKAKSIFKNPRNFKQYKK